MIGMKSASWILGIFYLISLLFILSYRCLTPIVHQLFIYQNLLFCKNFVLSTPIIQLFLVTFLSIVYNMGNGGICYGEKLKGYQIKQLTEIREQEHPIWKARFNIKAMSETLSSLKTIVFLLMTIWNPAESRERHLKLLLMASSIAVFLLACVFPLQYKHVHFMVPQNLSKFCEHNKH